MSARKNIPLFWWSEKRLMQKQKENYGDLLSKYLVEKISGLPVKWVHPKKKAWYKPKRKNYLAVGSILHHATSNSIVWGSGIIDRKQKIENADFKVVRGPESRKYLHQSGYDCPEVYGDPALLLPLYFNPEYNKQYKYGVVPHYADFKQIKNIFRDNQRVNVVDLMTNDIEGTTAEILKCERIVSTSLHGGIIAHSYGIPAVFARMENNLFGDGVKYHDYMHSVDMESYELPFFTRDMEVFFNTYESRAVMDKIDKLRNGLLKACPFRNINEQL